MSNINFGFISELEGGATCTGYVPDAANSKSGVTIATGFDIGQCDEAALSWLLPDFIAEKLSIYCGLKSIDAVEALTNKPLKINDNEAAIIDLCVKSQSTSYLIKAYNKSSSVKFEKLDEQAQTVIASVAFQYGNLAKRCPAFWHFATTQNWAAMLDELRNFGDRYTTRRVKEANYFLNSLMSK